MSKPADMAVRGLGSSSTVSSTTTTTTTTSPGFLCRLVVAMVTMSLVCQMVQCDLARQGKQLTPSPAVWVAVLDTETPAAELPAGATVKLTGGSWATSSGVKGFRGKGYHYCFTLTCQAKFTFTVPEADYYELLMSAAPHESRVQRARVSVTTDHLPTSLLNHTTVVEFDQTKSDATQHEGLVSLGVFYIDSGFARVDLSRGPEEGGAVRRNLVADALVVRRGIIRDCEDLTRTKIVGGWRKSTTMDKAGFMGSHYLVRDRNLPGSSVSWYIDYQLDVPADDVYAVYVDSIGVTDRSTNVPVIISHVDGTTRRVVDQTRAPKKNDKEVDQTGQWHFLGSFHLRPGTGQVRLGVGSAGRFTIADAVWVTRHTVVDTEHGDAATITGPWRESSLNSGYAGGHYLAYSRQEAGPAQPGDPVPSISYAFEVLYPGLYEVQLATMSAGTRSRVLLARLTLFGPPDDGSGGGSTEYHMSARMQNVPKAYWQTTGTCALEPGTHRIVLYGDAPLPFDRSKFVIGDAVRLMRRRAVTLDESQARLVPPDQWKPWNSVAGFVGNQYAVAPGGGAAAGAIRMAQWRLPRIQGVAEFDIYITFTPHETYRASKAVYDITSALEWRATTPGGGGVTGRQRVIVSQKKAAPDTWHRVGGAVMGYGTGELTLDAVRSNGPVSADGVKFVPRRRVASVLTNHYDEGVILEGTWAFSVGISGYLAGGGYRYCPSDGRATLPLKAPHAGVYGVFITYTAHPNRATAARVSIQKGKGGSGDANAAPAVTVDMRKNGGRPFPVGEVKVAAAGDIIKVVLDGRDSSGTLVVDTAFMVLRVPTCGPDEYLDSSASDDTYIVKPCIPLPNCAPGTRPGGTGSGDAADGSNLGKCVACEAGTWSAGGRGLYTCQEHAPPCAAGTAETQAATSTNDRECTACIAGQTFRDAQMAAAAPSSTCAACTRCSDLADQHQTQACAPASDAICAANGACGANEYVVKPATASAPIVCAPCSVCSAGTSESSPCRQEPGGDRQCLACAPNTYANAQGQSDCTPMKTRCPAGQYIATPGTALSDNVCANCKAGTLQAKDGISCTTCPAGTFVPSGAAGGASCADFACVAGTYDSDGSAATPCQPCAVGTFKDEDGAGACTSWTTECAAGEETAVRPSALSDRVCSPCSVGQTYKPIPGDGSCAPVRPPCDTEETETQSPTATRDRICKSSSNVPPVEADNNNNNNNNAGSSSSSGNPAASSGGGGGGESDGNNGAVIGGAVGGALGALLMVAAVAFFAFKRSRVEQSSSSMGTSTSVAFDNPMYAEGGETGKELALDGSGGVGDGALYDEPSGLHQDAFGFVDVGGAADSSAGYMDVNPLADSSAGYMDVNPLAAAGEGGDGDGYLDVTPNGHTNI